MSGIVIVGAGQAAGQAAAVLRQEGYEGDVMIVGEEKHPPYQRPPLSKQYLAGEQGIDRVYIRPERFYGEKQIEVRSGVRVDRLDPETKTLTTQNGESIGWDKLLLATGSRPRVLQVPGNKLSGIHYLRTITDVDAIREAMKTAERLVVIGGGYIGLEVASVAVRAGLDVTVLESEDRILQRVTTPEMSEFYHRLHTERGVTILTRTMVTGFLGDDAVTAIQADERVIEADLVIIGIGIIPNVELAQAAGLEWDNGIMVDEHCRTSVPDIYAAGACTDHPNPTLGRRLRLESVPNAMEQGRVAAINMNGGNRIYDAIPWFWSDQYELKLQMAGFSSDGDTQVLRGDKQARQFAIFYLKHGTVVAVDAVNSPREFMVCKQLYGNPVDTDKLADPGVDLKTLVPK